MPRRKRREHQDEGPLIGAHMSIAGGVALAPVRGHAVGCRCIQIFTKSNRQWSAAPLGEEDIAEFRANCEKLGIAPVVAHNCYLVNLAAGDPETYARSLDCFLLELQRTEALGLPGIVAHPGSRGDATEAKALRQVAGAIDELLERTAGAKAKIYLETTAGQGTSLGHRFEHLAEIIAAVRNKRRLAVCYDTGHTFAAGYDIRTPEAYQRTFEEFDKVIGLRRLEVFHFNDSKGDLGSRIDRHEHIGRGKIGEEAFRLILHDSRFRHAPKILETPKGKKGRRDWDAINIEVLRQLAARA